MNNLPKRHHYVPKCYLNLFTNSQKKFWKMRKDNLNILETSPSQVCYENELNKFRTRQLMDINNIEDEYFIEKKSFAVQENNYSKAVIPLTKFSNDQIVVDKIKHQIFLETLITIKRRNPDSKRKIIQSFQESYQTGNGIQLFINYLVDEFGIQNITPKFEEFIKKYLDTESHNDNRLHDMYLSAFLNKVDYTTIDNLTQLFYRLKQYILHVPIGKEFITSDNPGFTLIGNTTLSLGGFGGEFEFLFPLSPNSCLYLNSNYIESKSSIEKIIYPVMINSTRVEQINNITKSLCIKNIFSYNRKTLEKMKR